MLDVSCAFLYASIARDVYIELPWADPISKEACWVGKLKKALYGTRDAPQAWQLELSKTLVKMGFIMSKLHAGLYYHAERDLPLVDHVDDMLSSGLEENLVWLREELTKRYMIKVQMLREAGESVSLLGKNDPEN